MPALKISQQGVHCNALPPHLLQLGGVAQHNAVCGADILTEKRMYVAECRACWRPSLPCKMPCKHGVQSDLPPLTHGRQP